MAELLQELEEDIKREKILKFLHEQWASLLVISLVTILAVGAYSGYKSYQHKKQEEVGAKYFSAVKLAEAGKADAADKIFEELVSKKGGGFASLAGITLARKKYDAGDRNKALEFLKVVRDNAQDPNIKSLAETFSIYISTGERERSKLVPKVSSDSAFSPLEAELKAADMITAGEYKIASDLLNQAKSESVPTSSVHKRAGELLSLAESKGSLKK